MNQLRVQATYPKTSGFGLYVFCKIHRSHIGFAWPLDTELKYVYSYSGQKWNFIGHKVRSQSDDQVVDSWGFGIMVNGSGCILHSENVRAELGSHGVHATRMKQNEPQSIAHFYLICLDRIWRPKFKPARTLITCNLENSFKAPGRQSGSKKGKWLISKIVEDGTLSKVIMGWYKRYRML